MHVLLGTKAEKVLRVEHDSTVSVTEVRISAKHAITLAAYVHVEKKAPRFISQHYAISRFATASSELRHVLVVSAKTV